MTVIKSSFVELRWIVLFVFLFHVGVFFLFSFKWPSYRSDDSEFIFLGALLRHTEVKHSTRGNYREVGQARQARQAVREFLDHENIPGVSTVVSLEAEKPSYAQDLLLEKKKTLKSNFLLSEENTQSVQTAQKPEAPSPTPYEPLRLNP